MQDEHASAPDWRRAETYRPMLGAEPAVWAWEFARRGLVNNGLTAAEPNLPGLPVRSIPLDVQAASYLAASVNIVSLSIKSMAKPPEKSTKIQNERS